MIEQGQPLPASLQMVANCEQMLTTRYSRRLIVMEASDWVVLGLLSSLVSGPRVARWQDGNTEFASPPPGERSLPMGRRMGSWRRVGRRGVLLPFPQYPTLLCAARQKIRAYDAAEAAAYFEQRGPPK